MEEKRMLTEPTNEKLHALRLGAMAAAWATQREDPKMNEIDFDGRFGMLVDAEHLARDNKRLKRALREAKLRITNARIEDIDYAPKREVDRALVRQLGTCAWIGSHANVIITGATGTGKSYVACALAQQACRTGYRAVYRRMPRLIEELALAHADGTYTRTGSFFPLTNLGRRERPKGPSQGETQHENARHEGREYRLSHRSPWS
jgi:DNA replication protein DnaC